ncbi:hypothetical protein HWV62_34303 [Athelia sp. TMB]|nr:hypothetical protein HWV62_34303 [Athelia sp. TMB]
MPSINKCLVLLTLALSAVAANHGQHLSRNTHHDLAARAPVAAPADALAAPFQKRASNSKRCKAKPVTSSTSSTHKETTTSKKAAHADVEPTSTSSKYTPPPKPSPTTSSKESKPTSGAGMTTGGVGTYYLQNGVEGACGKVNPDSAIICALQTSLYANGANCGKTVRVTNLVNMKTVDVLVADECPTCDNEESIDFSKGAFEALGGTVEEGEFKIGFIML